MSQKANDQSALDPFGALRSMRDAGLDAWSKMMIQFVNTDAYAQATGAALDTWLTTSAPFRKALESTMTQVLTQLNMPTRSDVVVLAERLTNIEMRLDDLETKLDAVQSAGQQTRPAKSQDPT